jgi:hypothetical protein
MKEATERSITVGFRKKPKNIFNEIESTTASMVRDGWVLKETLMEDGLGKIHLFFERELVEQEV